MSADLKPSEILKLPEAERSRLLEEAADRAAQMPERAWIRHEYYADGPRLSAVYYSEMDGATGYTRSDLAAADTALLREALRVIRYYSDVLPNSGGVSGAILWAADLLAVHPEWKDGGR